MDPTLSCFLPAVSASFYLMPARNSEAGRSGVGALFDVELRTRRLR